MSSEFDSLALSPALLAVVAELGYQHLTPIQAETIPALLTGRDLIGQSKTGSGKTAAFALPILQRLSMDTRALQAIVLCPTRELCAQVTREIRKLGRKHPGLQVLPVAGGEPLRHQAASLQRGVHIVVGTPGRVLDHLRRETLKLDAVATVVLDEADRMLDMGFQEQMEDILRATPDARQTVLFSATFPPSIVAMTRAHQTNPVRVTIEENLEAKPEIRQLAHAIGSEPKIDVLRLVLAEHAPQSALVFCNLKRVVSEVAQTLTRAGISADALHGDLEQFERDRVLAKFRNQSVCVLVATDVAARGIDIPDLDLVVNFDLPLEPEVYVHRIGRTGRAGKQGLSVSLVSPADQDNLRTIQKMIQKMSNTPIEEVPLPGLVGAAGADRRSPDHGQAKMDTIRISGGRKDKVRPGDILGALTGEAGGLQGQDIGKIEIHDHLSYVAVAKSVSRTALRSLDNGRIKGRRFRAAFV